MTIEIKQLIIRAVVEERRERTVAVPHRAAPAPAPAAVGLDREAVIAECARRVLRALRKDRGR